MQQQGFESSGLVNTLSPGDEVTAMVKSNEISLQA